MICLKRPLMVTLYIRIRMTAYDAVQAWVDPLPTDYDTDGTDIALP